MHRSHGSGTVVWLKASAGSAQSDVDGSAQLSNFGVRCCSSRRFFDSKVSADSHTEDHERVEADVISFRHGTSATGGIF